MNKYSDIVGQDHIRDYLTGNVRSGKIAHAYMIAGADHAGKSFIANIFAASIQCEEEDADKKPCGKCHSCIQAAAGSHPDIIRIEHEKPNIISVNEIREQLIADIGIKPYNGKYKIYIIPEAEKMNVQAQNAILKTLEEPPEYAVIILLCSNPAIMLSTIVSRCVRLTMKPVDEDVLIRYLMKELKVPDYNAKICASFARGNLGKARNLAGNEEFSVLRDEMVAIFKHFKDMDVGETLGAIEKLTEHKTDIEEILEMFTVWFRDVLVYKATKDTDALVFSEEVGLIRKAAESTYEGINGAIDAVRTASERLKANVNFEVVTELMLISIKENLK